MKPQSVQRPPNWGRKGLPPGHAVHPQMAHMSGKHGKKQGWARLSPYYEAPKSDHFWFAGYDGKTMEQAIASQALEHELKMEIVADQIIEEQADPLLSIKVQVSNGETLAGLKRH